MRQAGQAGEEQLRRELGLVAAIFVVVNATIGTGIFKTPAKIARLSGELEVYLTVWVAGGLIALCGALTIAELAAAWPRTGGMYEWLRRVYGRTVAFVFGWTMLVLLLPSSTGSFARLAAEAVASLAGWAPDPSRESGVAVLILLLCVAANLVGLRTSSRVQTTVAVTKYGGVLLLGIVGLTAPLSPLTLPAPPGGATTASLAGAFAALVSVMWAYDGWADLSRVSGEIRDPSRTLPRALAIGSIVIILVYLAANLGYARALGIAGLQASTTGANMPAANLALATVGAAGLRALSALILLSCVGACMTTLFTGPRVFVAMATDGLFVRALGAVSPRTGVPARAVLACGLVGAAHVAFRSFEQLTEAFVAGFFPFYMLAVVAVFILRRREPGLARPFRVPGYPVVPVIFLAGASALLAGAFVDVDRTALFSFVVMLAGVPIALVFRSRAR